MFFSRERAGACEGPSAVSEGSSAVPNRLASLKSKTGGTIPPRSAIRNRWICSKFFSRELPLEVLSKNFVDNKRRALDACLRRVGGLMPVFIARPAALSAVTTATLTHLMGRPHPRGANEMFTGIIPTSASWHGNAGQYGRSAYERATNFGLFFEVAEPPNAKTDQKQRTSASACARRRSSTAVLACSVDRNCPPRFPGTCAILNTVSAATYRS
jgi:hypothetical protein